MTSLRALRHVAARAARVAHILRRDAVISQDVRAWHGLVGEVNRQMLLGTHARSRLVRLKQQLSASAAHSDGTWKMALPTLGSEHAHRLSGSSAEIRALEGYFGQHVGADGEWRTPVGAIDHAMKGYTLQYLESVTGHAHYRKATEELASALLYRHPRESDGALPYSRSTSELLVDSLAMISPFLARHARITGNEVARGQALTQLFKFIEQGVDPESRLPFHGYYADGPKRLGVHGWGRGVGWYMVGLVDTLAELPNTVIGFERLVDALDATAHSLRLFQRADGHWHWVVPHRVDVPDTSTTALVGYGLARGIQLGLLDESYHDTVERAVHAVVSATRRDGLVDGSLAECRGLGKYPQVYGPAPWLQGASVALGAVFLSLRQ